MRPNLREEFRNLSDEDRDRAVRDMCGLDDHDSYDWALPQDYVNAALKLGEDVRGNFVTAYSRDTLGGSIMPVTLEGVWQAARMAEAAVLLTIRNG